MSPWNAGLGKVKVEPTLPPPRPCIHRTIVSDHVRNCKYLGRGSKCDKIDEYLRDCYSYDCGDANDKRDLKRAKT